MKADGSGVTQLTRANDLPAQAALWSPSSKQVAYTLQTGSGCTQITAVNLDGTNPQNLPVPLSGATGIAVDPTNQKIYFGSFNASGLLQMNYNGTGLTAVVNNGGNVGAVAIDLENGHVYFGGNGISAGRVKILKYGWIAPPASVL